MTASTVAIIINGSIGNDERARSSDTSITEVE
jgi:hypothetical protein